MVTDNLHNKPAIRYTRYILFKLTSLGSLCTNINVLSLSFLSAKQI